MWRARCCVSKARPTPARVAIGASAGGASLRRELASLPLKDLRKRAKADGMPAADLEDAMDADDPEELFTSFLVQMHADAAGGGGDATAQLRQELQGLRTMALHRRALSEGVSPDQVDIAMDSASPKEELIALMLAQWLAVTTLRPSGLYCAEATYSVCPTVTS